MSFNVFYSDSDQSMKKARYTTASDLEYLVMLVVKETGENFPVLAAVLNEHSDFFRYMLRTTNFKEASIPVPFPVSSVKRMLRWLNELYYTGRVHVGGCMEDIEPDLRIANYYQIHAVVEAIEDDIIVVSKVADLKKLQILEDVLGPPKRGWPTKFLQRVLQQLEQSKDFKEPEHLITKLESF